MCFQPEGSNKGPHTFVLRGPKQNEHHYSLIRPFTHGERTVCRRRKISLQSLQLYRRISAFLITRLIQALGPPCSTNQLINDSNKQVCFKRRKNDLSEVINLRMGRQDFFVTSCTYEKHWTFCKVGIP